MKKQKISNYDADLAEYHQRKCKEFEGRVRRAPWDVDAWVQYANWEDSHNEFDRSRSVWERALEADGRNHRLWIKYAEMEMKNKFINHARNIWDRAAALFPTLDQIWYKYIHMEETLGNIAGARQIFERWMSWNPNQQAWLSYNDFELRNSGPRRAREIHERFALCHPGSQII